METEKQEFIKIGDTVYPVNSGNSLHLCVILLRIVAVLCVIGGGYYLSLAEEPGVAIFLCLEWFAGAIIVWALSYITQAAIRYLQSIPPKNKA